MIFKKYFEKRKERKRKRNEMYEALRAVILETNPDLNLKSKNPLKVVHINTNNNGN